MDSEESRADYRGDWPEQLEKERENQRAEGGVERDARQVKHERRAAACDPLDGEPDRDDRSVERCPVLRRPVG